MYVHGVTVIHYNAPLYVTITDHDLNNKYKVELSFRQCHKTENVYNRAQAYLIKRPVSVHNFCQAASRLLIFQMCALNAEGCYQQAG